MPPRETSVVVEIARTSRELTSRAVFGITGGLDPTALQEAEQYYGEALGLARSSTGRKEREDCY